MGKLDWKPVRYGKQLWDIGYPDRTGGKFFKGDGANYWLWGWNLRYALLFPNDITYTIGKSDYHKDWFFEEVPHATNLSFVNPAAKDPANQRFGWVKAESLDQYPQTNTRGPGPSMAMAGQLPGPSSSTWTSPCRAGRLARRAGRRQRASPNWPWRSTARTPGPSATADPDNARLITTNTIRYNSDKGLWQERT